MIVFDPEKDAANRLKHGVSLSRAGDLEILAVIDDPSANATQVESPEWRGFARDSNTCAPALRLTSSHLGGGCARFAEPRRRAYGLIDGVLYCLAYSLRDGDVRAISLRRAHAKEVRRFVFEG